MSIDANEESSNNHIPQPYNKSDLLSKIGLKDAPFEILGGTSSITYPKKRIDFVLVTTGLLSTITCTGWCEYNVFAQSDHRAGYIDFDSDIFPK